MKSYLAAAAALALLAGPAVAADNVKIGLVTTLSGAAGIIGNDMKHGSELALGMLGGKIGGLPAKLLFADDQFKPDVGRQVADEFLTRDKVDFLTGFIWSNVLLAAYQPIIESGKILISANAGPHEIAGAKCAPNFFSASWQNDQTPEAMGKYMADQKIDNVYLIAPDYAAGRDMMTGFKRYFKGKIAAETYTKFGQSDYQVEISQIRDAKPKAVFAFLPGGMGIQFVKQYAQSGLRETIPLYTAFTVDETTLPAIGEAAEGNYEVSFWSPDLDNPQNKRFIKGFHLAYGEGLPSFYAAQSFDAINMIDHAVAAVHGDLDNRDGMIADLAKADFGSVRGPFKYNVNHFPIENFYLLKIVKEDDKFVRKIQQTVFADHADSYAGECKMK